MAEVNVKLSKREADALAQDWTWRKSSTRRSAEFKLREAIWAVFPELREKDLARAENRAHEDQRLRDMRDAMGLS